MTKRIEKRKVLVVVLTTCLATGVANAVLVARWDLDEASGVTVSDSSGNGYDGTLRGGLSFDKDSVTGVIANALEFDGSDDRVIMPKTFSMPTDGFTIVLWFSPDPALDSGSRPACLVHWAEEDYPYLMFNKLGRGEIGLWVDHEEDLIYLVTETHSWEARMWYHIAVTFDGADLKLYINGHLEDTGKYPRDSIQGKGQFCFGATPSGSYAFRGRLDDVCIYGGAHSAEEVTNLFRPSALEDLVDAVREAQSLVKERRFDEAETFIEEIILEYEKGPVRSAALDKMVRELHFQLAKAKEGVGSSKEDVVAEYRDAVESGEVSLSTCGSALLWLCQNANEAYNDIVASVIQNNSDYVRAAVATAEVMVREGKSKDAVRFLEANLVACGYWRERHPYEDVEDRLPELYFQLAKAKEAAGLPGDAIADAYTETFIPSDRRYVARRATALIWLLQNEHAQEYTEVIKSLAQSSDVNSPQVDIVRKVCMDLESTKNWGVYERFLDTLFASARHPGNWAVLVGSCLSDKENQWAKRYYKHVSSKRGLVFRGESILAEEYMAEKKFKKAAAIYRDILKRCGPDDDRARFEFQLCKCLLNARQYREAKSKLESFISNNRAMYRDLAKQAMLMKGRTHVQLGELDEALDSYFTLMVEYPDLENVPEINFFIGYCYMLQGKLKAAAGAFDCLVTGYPESDYTEKARVCLGRLEDSMGLEPAGPSR